MPSAFNAMPRTFEEIKRDLDEVTRHLEKEAHDPKVRVKLLKQLRLLLEEADFIIASEPKE